MSDERYYKPFGEEWRKEMNNFTKKELIERIRILLIEKGKK